MVCAVPGKDARTPHPTPTVAGVLYALGAYGSWGLLPVYWKELTPVPVLEILAHRVVWSVAFAALLLSASRGWLRVRTVLSSRRNLVTLLATSLLIATNWLLFIFAVTHGEVLASSLGYFLNPLVNVVLGIVFLRERLRPWQVGSVLLAAFGVVPMAWSAGGLPWISLALALSFGVYGLLRKVSPMAPLVSLSIETALLGPIAAFYLVWLEARGASALLRGDPKIVGLLILSGVVTALPLLWFASAAERLRLSTLGLFQYLAPSGHFLLAVLAYGEPFTPGYGVAFGCIWSALAVYSIDAMRAQGRPDPAHREPFLAA
jgi:chloramphenicol-sensitive protein RarD